jgi:sporulation protein YunB
MKNIKNIKSINIKRKLIGVLCVILGLTMLIDIKIRPIIRSGGIYQSRIYAVRLINDCVTDLLLSRHYTYGDFCQIVTNSGDSTAYIQTNAAEINIFKTLITSDIQKRLRDGDRREYNIYLGTLTGVEMLYGKGPAFPIIIRPKGYAATSLISEFKSVGINQTKHAIYLEVEVEITAYVPGYSTTSFIKDKFLLTESIIIGKIPDAYTYIDGLSSTQNDVVGAVEDFGATQ